MREQGFVDIQKRFLVIYEEIKKVTLITASKVRNFDPVLSQLSQLQQTVFKLLRLLAVALELLELLAVVDLVLQAALHDVFADLFDAADEESLHFVALLGLVNIFGDALAFPHSFFFHQRFQVPDRVAVVRFKCLDILNHLALNPFVLHA